MYPNTALALALVSALAGATLSGCSIQSQDRAARIVVKPADPYPAEAAYAGSADGNAAIMFVP